MKPLTSESNLEEIAEYQRAVLGVAWSENTRIAMGYCRLVTFEFLDKTRPISSFTSADIAGLINHWIQKRHYNGRSLRGRLGWVREMFKIAVNLHLLQENPACGARLPKIQKTIVSRVPFTAAQFDRLLASLQDRLTTVECDMWTAACRVAYHTGMRISDVATLRWTDAPAANYVDWERECIVARPKKTWAYRKEVEIPMEPELYDLLARLYKERRQDKPWVIPLFNWHQVRDRHFIKHRFKVLCDRAGLSRHSFHSFRHGFVSRLVNAGVDVAIVKAMTGQSESVVRAYIHVSHEAKTAALAQSRAAMHNVRLKEAGFQRDVA